MNKQADFGSEKEGCHQAIFVYDAIKMEPEKSWILALFNFVKIISKIIEMKHKVNFKKMFENWDIDVRR